MSITATDLKMYLGKYLLPASKEDIHITKNGKIIAKLVSPQHEKTNTMEDLLGCIPDTVSLETAMEERLNFL